VDDRTVELVNTIATHWEEVVAFASGSVASGFGSAAGGDVWTAAKRIVGRHDRTTVPSLQALTSAIESLLAQGLMRMDEIEALAMEVSKSRRPEPQVTASIDSVTVSKGDFVIGIQRYER